MLPQPYCCATEGGTAPPSTAFGSLPSLASFKFAELGAGVLGSREPLSTRGTMGLVDVDGAGLVEQLGLQIICKSKHSVSIILTFALRYCLSWCT